jgi:hypothetical protein
MLAELQVQVDQMMIWMRAWAKEGASEPARICVTAAPLPPRGYDPKGVARVQRQSGHEDPWAPAMARRAADASLGEMPETASGVSRQIA